MLSEVLRVEFDRRNKITVSQSSNDGYYLNRSAQILNFKVVDYERVIFVSYCYCLLVTTYIEAERLTIMIFSFEGICYFNSREIEESNVIVATSSHNE
jgi:hypothetical protein